MVVLAATRRRTGRPQPCTKTPALCARLLQQPQRLRQQGAAGIVEHQLAPTRSNSWLPSARSSCCNAALVADWDSDTAWAAATVLPDWATAQNISTWRSVRCSMGTLLFA
jgi:hypothetical protein